MRLIMLIVFPLLLTAAPAFSSVRSALNAGNGLYKKGAFDQSLEKYREAEIKNPGHPAVNFNKGDALYKLEDYDGASNAWRAGQRPGNPAFESAVEYNLGNNAWRQGKTDEAVNHYKKALILNPKDEDAKYNLEYIMTQKKENNQKKNDDKKNKNQDKKDKEKDKEKQQQRQQQEKNKSGMSKEDAERILKAAGQNDRDASQKRKTAVPQIPKTDEDW